jgi:hypothetical protein
MPLSAAAKSYLSLLVRRGPDGVIMPRNCNSPEHRVDMFRFRVRELAKKKKDAHIAACPTKHGDSYHHQQDYASHLWKLQKLCRDIDELVGEFVFFTVSEYNPEIRDRYEADWSGSIPRAPHEAKKLDFAIELETALENLWSDCLYHKLLTMDDDDLAFFACTLSRLPTRPDNGIFAM